VETGERDKATHVSALFTLFAFSSSVKLGVVEVVEAATVLSVPEDDLEPDLVGVTGDIVLVMASNLLIGLICCYLSIPITTGSTGSEDEMGLK
jgi:hypothetical protein